MNDAKSRMIVDVVAGCAVVLALAVTAYYGYLAWLLVSPD